MWGDVSGRSLAEGVSPVNVEVAPLLQLFSVIASTLPTILPMMVIELAAMVEERSLGVPDIRRGLLRPDGRSQPGSVSSFPLGAVNQTWKLNRTHLGVHIYFRRRTH
jgi:hypothetical protein